MTATSSTCAPARRVGAAHRAGRGHRQRRCLRAGQGHGRLIAPEDRERFVGVVVNRFRGDPTLFDDGITTLEALDRRARARRRAMVAPTVSTRRTAPRSAVDAPLVREPLQRRRHPAPAVANTEDLAPLFVEPDASQSPGSPTCGRRRAATCSILPGTKATIGRFGPPHGIGHARGHTPGRSAGTWVLGLCGGYQMMGARLEDPAGLDGPVGAWPGLAMFGATTRFVPDKTLALRRATSRWPEPGHALDGYEIHHGRTSGAGTTLAAEEGASLGLVGERAVGTYLHGLLRSDPWRAAFLARPSGSRAARERTRGLRSDRGTHRSLGPARAERAASRCVGADPRRDQRFQ